jgi:hypothetical protein
MDDQIQALKTFSEQHSFDQRQAAPKFRMMEIFFRLFDKGFLPCGPSGGDVKQKKLQD